MNATAQTKIFGIRLGIDPKILVVGLLGIAAVIFWINSRGGNEGSSPHVINPEQTSPIASSVTKGARQADRRRGSHQDRGTLRLRAVDPTRGDVDPTLRLDFLDRLSKVQAPASMRNLFEAGPAIEPGAPGAAVPNRVIAVKTPELPRVRPSYPITPQIAANIPYKYYGFAKPVNPGDGNRGFFMEGDNVFVAVEGQLLQNRYLVVQLTPNDARVEDTQVKLGKTLPVVPEAREQPGAAGPQPVESPDANPVIMNQGIDDNNNQ
jgi:hypothetical protein